VDVLRGTHTELSPLLFVICFGQEVNSKPGTGSSCLQSSSSGDRYQEDHSSKPTQSNNSRHCILGKKKKCHKGAGRMAQDAGAKFKPQH
jgi:hypothetical protein